MQKSHLLTFSYTALASSMLLLINPSAALAQDNSAKPFTLGTVVVVGQRFQTGTVGDEQIASVINQQQMQQFNRENIGDALNLITGITLSNGTRNEKTLNLRGFDSRQVPLFIDGIPVYVPYDGNIDLNRFTTADLAAIQVDKGFSSVAYGANTLGGAINLISRKPSKKLEGDVNLGFGSDQERKLSANIGTNQGAWYLQAGLSALESDGFSLSSDFVATTTEDGGQRNNAYRQDQKLSLKVGLTPNASDEYSLSYYKQDGEKGQPPSTVPASARYWQWPYWNKESLYFVSNTAIGQHEFVKVRIYHDSFDNEVDSFTNGTYTTLKTSGSGSVGTGRSIYNDQTSGGSLELESLRFDAHSLRFVTHYKTDEHEEIDATGFKNTQFKDELFSIALEDNIQLASAFTLSLGAAQHRLKPQEVFSVGNPYSVPSTQTANDVQSALFYDVSNSARFYASIAKKTRLPTLKDRYSQRLGTFIENPSLGAEEAVNYEIGYQGSPWAGSKAEAAIFYSDISNKIQEVKNVSGTKSQMQNMGEVQSSGIELGLNDAMAEWLDVGANYSYIKLKNRSAPATRLTDVPQQKIITHATWHTMQQLDVTAFAEYNSSRWVSNTAELAGFSTVNLKAAYKPIKNTVFEAGVNNLSDKNYSLAEGFPREGRMWFVNANYQF